MNNASEHKQPITPTRQDPVDDQVYKVPKSAKVQEQKPSKGLGRFFKSKSKDKKNESEVDTNKDDKTSYKESSKQKDIESLVSDKKDKKSAFKEKRKLETEGLKVEIKDKDG